jgi:hypothetical protein
MKHRSDCTHIAIGNKSNFKRRFLAICSLFILMCGGNSVHAQSVPPLDYCHGDFAEKRCFDSLPKALAYLKTFPQIAPTAQYLQLLSTKVLYPTTGEMEYTYGHVYVPATVIHAPSYQKYLYVNEPGGNLGCAPTTSPYKPGWCSSESELITLSENFIKSGEHHWTPNI